LGELKYSYQEAQLRPENTLQMQQQQKDSQQKLSRKKNWGKHQKIPQTEGEEDEHSEEWLKNFSQVAETKTPAALKLTTEEEHVDKMLTPWEMELEMLEDWLNHPEPVDDCHEETVMQMIAEEHSEESLRIFSQGAEQMITAVLRHAAEDEGEFQSEEQLEEAIIQPSQGELAEAKLSEKEAEQQLLDN
jgi:hypothetical protein